MPYDDKLRLLGTTGDPRQTLATAGSFQGNAQFAYPQRTYRGRLRIGGAVSGTSPTLDMRVQTSPTGTGSWTTKATFPQQILSMVGYTSAGVPRYEVPGSDSLTQSFEMGSDQYVRLDYTVGGTTPSFGNVSVELEPVNAAASLRSGR